MSDTTTPPERLPNSSRDRRTAIALIGGHVMPHVALQGFFVIVPQIYAALSLTPVSVGMLEMVRRAGGGLASIGGGFLVDRYADRRIPFLYGSLLAIGLSYFAIGYAPTFPILLVAVGVAGAAHSLWHPAAMGLLSARFPARRGLMISMHRSSGSVGDVIGPLIVGGLLVIISWQTILVGAVPLAAIFAVGMWLLLRGTAGGAAASTAASNQTRSFGSQMRTLRGVLRSPGLAKLIGIAMLSGLGQGGLLLWLSLYLSESLQMGSVGIGFHVALLTGLGIVLGPVVGSMSDRIGRSRIITAVLIAKVVFAISMAVTVSGLGFTISVALMGTVFFGANPLIQAAALDAAEGQQLEGSMLGLLWGMNAVTTGLSPVIVGVLVDTIGYGAIFWYVAAVNAAASILAFALPRRVSATS